MLFVNKHQFFTSVTTEKTEENFSSSTALRLQTDHTTPVNTSIVKVPKSIVASIVMHSFMQLYYTLDCKSLSSRNVHQVLGWFH